MIYRIFSVMMTTYLILSTTGCWPQDKKQIKHDLDATEVQFSPPPGKYTQPVDVEIKLGSSDLSEHTVHLEIQDETGFWDVYRESIHLDSTRAIRYRLFYVSDLKVEGDEKTSLYEISP